MWKTCDKVATSPTTDKPLKQYTLNTVAPHTTHTQVLGFSDITSVMQGLFGASLHELSLWKSLSVAATWKL